MKCPVCKNDLIIVEYQAIELDHCLNCRGVWFDSEELELLWHTMKLEATGLPHDLLKSPEAKSLEKKRKCPICSQKMSKSILGQEPGVLVDTCPRGEGLWFDGGEVEQLVTSLAGRTPAPSDSKSRILSFLGEVFQAKNK